MDLESVLLALQAFSAEVAVERMLNKILEIVLVTAGAQRGALALARDEALIVVTTRGADVGAPAKADRPLGACEDLPRGLIQAVFNSGRTLLLTDALVEDSQIGASYLNRHRPRSVLCMPLLHLSRPMGVLYLENNVATGTFTLERKGILHLITSQLAISLQYGLTIERLIAANRMAEAANRAKSTFLATMSHELRTPLNAIIGYCELLMEDLEETHPEESWGDLQHIRYSGRHLLSIINDILDLSKIEAGMMALYVTRFALAPLVEQIVEALQVSSKAGDNVLRVELSGELGELESDATKVRQVVMNLLSNSLKFTQRGSVTLKVSPLSAPTLRGLTGSGEWVALEVIDTGIGMRQEDADQVFDAFHQIDSSSTRRFTGTGLGLTITQHLCRLLGGEVAVCSEVGVGSTFRVELPRRAPAEEV